MPLFNAIKDDELSCSAHLNSSVLYVHRGSTGTSSMNNLQEVNLVFMFMMSSNCKKMCYGIKSVKKTLLRKCEDFM